MSIRVIDPAALIREHMILSLQGQVVAQEQRWDVFHSTLITVAAALCNELTGLKSPFSWAKEYGAKSITAVILQTVDELEREFDCFNPDANNASLLQEKQKELLNAEKKLGHAPFSFLLED